MLIRMSATDLNGQFALDPVRLSPFAGVAGIIIDGPIDQSRIEELGVLSCAVLSSDPGFVDLSQVDLILDSPHESSIQMNARLHPVAFASAARVVRLASQLPPLDALYLESVTYSLLQSGDEFARWLNDNREKLWRAGRESSVVEVRRADETLNVSLAEPERHNAFSRFMRDELREALTLAVLDETITRVVLDGHGSNFSSGGDLAEFGTSKSPLDSHLVRTTDSVAQLLLTIGERIGTGLECRVHGHNIGAGVELAAFAPRVVAAPGTTFRLPEVSMGLVPGAGGTVSVTRRIGRHRAALMMLSGCTVDAETALDWGLIDEIGDRT